MLQARSDPADLSLDGETVIIQVGGGDDGVGGVHGAVTVLTTLICHTPHPAYLHLLPQVNLLACISEL